MKGVKQFHFLFILLQTWHFRKDIVFPVRIQSHIHKCYTKVSLGQGGTQQLCMT